MKKNRVEKFFITLSSAVFVAVVVMFMKVSDESKALSKIKGELARSITLESQSLQASSAQKSIQSKVTKPISSQKPVVPPVRQSAPVTTVYTPTPVYRNVQVAPKNAPAPAPAPASKTTKTS